MTARDARGKTALHYCASNSTSLLVQLVVSRDRSVLDMPDSAGHTPLHAAVIAGNVDVVTSLYGRRDVTDESWSRHQRPGRRASHGHALGCRSVSHEDHPHCRLGQLAAKTPKPDVREGQNIVARWAYPNSIRTCDGVLKGVYLFVV